MADPKSITELKPGSNYLIVYNRGDMPKEGVAALSEELLSLAGTLGASCTIVVVPDGCSMEVSEVPSSAEVLALLRSVEWMGDKQGVEACPKCGADQYVWSKGECVKGPHAHDCALDAMIKRCEAAPSAAPRPTPYNPRPPRIVG